MSEHLPKVSIGLPVYNGEKYLEQAIESILSQTFTDFELIISDNASTDRTPEICQRYAAQDARIRYHRNATNIGGANNENLTFKLSRAPYFRNAADDDYMAPEWLAKAVEVLDTHPDVVLAYSRAYRINEEGKEIGTLNRLLGTADRPHERFRNLYTWEHNCEPTYGLVRRDVMAKTDLQMNYTDSDRTFLCELSLHGKFYQIPEFLFYKRYHAGMSTQVFPDYRERMVWFDPDFKKKGKVAMPHWNQFFHYLRIIRRAPINLGEKLRCYLHMVRWLFLYRRWSMMGRDLVNAILFYTRAPFRKKKA
ncbi:MAG: glycosyltransferase family 2 protein [Anaerolineales bacterium]